MSWADIVFSDLKWVILLEFFNHIFTPYLFNCSSLFPHEYVSISMSVSIAVHKKKYLEGEFFQDKNSN